MLRSIPICQINGLGCWIDTGNSTLKDLQPIDPAVTAAAILLCDQPFVSAALVRQLIEGHQRMSKSIDPHSLP